MRTSKAMQALITQLAEQHGLDLTVVGQSLRLDKEEEFPLIIEVVGVNRISIGHYFETKKNVCIPVLEVLIFTGTEEWVPLEYIALVRHVYAFTTDKGIGWHVDKDQIVDTVEDWANKLKSDGWLETGEMSGLATHQEDTHESCSRDE